MIRPGRGNILRTVGELYGKPLHSPRLIMQSFYSFRSLLSKRFVEIKRTIDFFNYLEWLKGCQLYDNIV